MNIKKLNEELNKILNESSEAQEIIANYNPMAVKVEEWSEGDGWSVLIKDKNSNWSAWVDVSINDNYKDVETEWNQYIFYNNDSEDMLSQELQNDDDIFDLATSEAINYLEEKEFIYQDENGNWFKK